MSVFIAFREWPFRYERRLTALFANIVHKLAKLTRPPLLPGINFVRFLLNRSKCYLLVIVYVTVNVNSSGIAYNAQAIYRMRGAFRQVIK